MERDTAASSGWAFQLTYKSRLVSTSVRNKNYAKRFVDRFLKISEVAQLSAANSLTLVSA